MLSSQIYHVQWVKKDYIEDWVTVLNSSKVLAKRLAQCATYSNSILLVLFFLVDGQFNLKCCLEAC